MVIIKNKMSTVSIIMLFFLLAGSTSMLSGQRSTYSFEDLERLAKTKDASTMSAAHKLDASKAELKYSGAKYWPVLSTYYRHFPGEIDIDAGDISTRNSLVLRLSYDLFKDFKMGSLRSDEKRHELATEEILLKQTERQALFQFRSIWIDMLKEKASVSYYQSLVEIMSELLSLQKTEYESGNALAPTLMRTRNDLEEARDLATYHQNMLKEKKDFVLRSFNLGTAALRLDPLSPPPSLPQVETIIRSAIPKNITIQNLARETRRDKLKKDAVLYENMSLAPYIGARFWDKGRAGIEVGPELGLKFQVNLGVFQARSSRKQQYLALQRAWALDRKSTELSLRQDLRKQYALIALSKTKQKAMKRSLRKVKEEARIKSLQNAKAVRRIDPGINSHFLLEKEERRLRFQSELEIYNRHLAQYHVLYLAGIDHYNEILPDRSIHDDRTEQTTVRAMWVWKTYDIIHDNAGVEDFLSFCRSRGINRVFLSVTGKMLKTRKRKMALSAFVASLHQAGLKVSALMGESHWVFPDKRKVLLSRINDIHSYNQQNSTFSRFDAIHLDIEPHTLASWKSRKEKYLDLFIETLAEAREYLQRHDTGMNLEIDIPAFWSKINRSHLNAMLQLVDLTTIMAYERKTASRIIRSTARIREQGFLSGTPVIIGLNVPDFKTEKQLEHLIKTTMAQFNAADQPYGFGIHHYKNYRALTPY